jgi:hypothetical protein
MFSLFCRAQASFSCCRPLKQRASHTPFAARLRDSSRAQQARNTRVPSPLLLRRHRHPALPTTIPTAVTISSTITTIVPTAAIMVMAIVVIMVMMMFIMIIVV